MVSVQMRCQENLLLAVDRLEKIIHFRSTLHHHTAIEEDTLWSVADLKLILGSHEGDREREGEDLYSILCFILGGSSNDVKRSAIISVVPPIVESFI